MLNFRMRKLTARIALPFVFIFLVVSPAYALIGLAPLVIRLGGSAALGTGVEVSALIHLAALGYSLPFIEVSSPSSPISVRIPTTEAQPVPAPATPPSVPAESVPTYTSQIAQYVLTGSTPLEAGQAMLSQCHAMGGCADAASIDYVVQLTATGWDLYATLTDGRSNWQYGSASLGPSVVTCPAGTTQSGSDCIVTNPREVSADSACDYSRSGTALGMISDPECASSGTFLETLCGLPGTTCQGVKFNRTNSNGQPEVVTVTPTASGGSDIVVQTQRQSGSTPVIDSTTISVNGSGTVTGVTGGTQTGNISANPDGSLAVNGTGNSVTPTDVSFPSDYATTGEAQDAIDSISPTLQSISDSLTVSGSVADPVEPSANDMPGWGNTFSGLTGWQLPAHGSSCPTPSVDLSAVLGAGSVYTFDGHCALISDHFQALQAAMMLVWTMLSVMIVLRA